ncbi:hypothetical protein ACNKFW_01825 [Paracoccus sp. TD-10]|uniref:hypothetical protein n=1 Tax=unclassified Paracoccus (in: a-proteobacteria) TaxID=2688777 RepID=UPI000370610E|nr:hypothetical protein [Paracoccus sp. N5]
MTLSPLELHSEPYGSTGNIGENFRRLLGAPTLDPLQTVIREAVQNIADAARPGVGSEILIRLRTLSDTQHDILRSVILAEVPEEPGSSATISGFLEAESAVVLEICDFGTVGLGGPTRSDRIPVGTEQTNFIDFLRNIGTARDTEQGGGTYGFGKVALYRASACSTIIVDTLPDGAGTEGRRLMACHVGRSFERPENGMRRRFTGRHWWGVKDPEDGIADPATGAAASALASHLGLPDRDPGRSGTSIMILGFQPDEGNLTVTGNRIIETLLWSFWPRMMRSAPAKHRFACKVMVEDQELPVPAPEDLAPFDLLCKAMSAARARKGNDVRRIESQRPQKFLGTLAIEKGLRSPRRHLTADEDVRLVPGQMHHIALMRPVELVVKYLEGNPLPDARLEWAGVFIASDEDEVEQAFADSEPPAHDDWVPDNLPRGNEKRYVNIALRRLREIAAEMGMEPISPRPGEGSGPPLARLAGRLGAVLENVGGDGAGRRRGSGGSGGGRPSRARASRPVFQRLEAGDAGRIAVFLTEVTQDTRRSGVKLVASASVAVEGATLGSADDTVGRPDVLSVRWLDGEAETAGNTLDLGGREGRFEIRVLVPEDCAVTADADVILEAGA